MTKQALQATIAAEVADQFGTTVTRAQLLEVQPSIQKRYSTGVSFMQAHSAGRGMYDLTPFLNEEILEEIGAPTVERTDEEILADQRLRYHTLSRMGEEVAKGKVRSMIVSGAPGTGKTFTIEALLETAAEAGKITFESVSGYVRPTGLYKMLWENREKNNVILLDDADSIFEDAAALNLLKAALDTTKRRILSWRSEKVFEDREGEPIPDSFEYKGSIIFITNLDFDKMINTKNGPHFAALISRSFYMDLNMASTREFMLRIKDVLATSNMAKTMGLSAAQTKVVMSFVENNYNKLRELSLRMVLKLGGIMLFAKDDADFENMARMTCFKAGVR